MTRVRLFRTNSDMWCLMWSTSSMSAPVFWYYGTKQEATEALIKMVETKNA